MKHYWWVLPMLVFFVILYKHVPLWLYITSTALTMATNVLLTDAVAKSKSK